MTTTDRDDEFLTQEEYEQMQDNLLEEEINKRLGK